VGNIYSKYKKYKDKKSLTEITLKKIKYLNKNKLYKVYPFNEIPPTLTKYKVLDTDDKRSYNYFYSCNGIPDKNYIPLTLYYTFIEPKLNNYDLLKAFEDKNSYNLAYPNIGTPITLLRKINNQFFDSNYEIIINVEKFIADITCKSEKAILKPSIDSGSGKNILVFTNKEGVFYCGNQIMSLNFLLRYPDFILQEFVLQNEFFNKYNYNSNNTIRIFVYKNNKNRICILHRLLRIGAPGKFTDHDNTGGIAIGINESHTRNKFGFLNNGIMLNIFNNYNLAFDEKIPFIDEIEEISYEICKKIFYARLIALDFTVNKNNEPLLIEINCMANGISQYQLNNGGVFGDFTEEILKNCFI